MAYPGTPFWLGGGLLLAAAALTAPAPRPGPALNPSPEMAAVLLADPRLEPAVTLHSERQPLSALLAELGRQVGVTLGAARDVADEPAVVWMTGRPAREVMQHLALLFNYRWARSGLEGRWRYELYQDEKARREEQALRAAEDRAAVERMIADLRLYVDAGRSSPEALQREHDRLQAETERYWADYRERPLREQAAARQQAEYQRIVEKVGRMHACRRMQEPGLRGLLRVVATLSPADWQALAHETALAFSTRAERGTRRLPAALASELRGLRPTADFYRISAAASRTPPTPESQAWADELDRKLQAQWAAVQDVRVAISLDRSDGYQNTMVWLSVVPTLLTATGAQPVLDANCGQLTFGCTYAEVRGDSPRAALDPEAVPASWASDPVLGARRRLKLDLPAEPWAERGEEGKPRVRLSDLLPRIAATSGIELVADAYRDPPGLEFLLPFDGERPLYYVLNRYALPFSRWTREGDVFHVRSASWYWDRLAEIPDRVARAWAARLRQRSELSLEEAARVVTDLRDEQLRHLAPVLRGQGVWLGGDSVGTGYWTGAGRREVLRVYANLSPAQRQLLLRGGRVPYGSLPPAARRWLLRGLRQRARASIGVPVPVAPEEGVLSLELQPFRRTVRAGRQYYGVIYEPATTAAPGSDREYLSGSIIPRHDDYVPVVPGLVTPVGGSAVQAVFRYRMAADPEAAFGCLLPGVDRRLPVSNDANPDRDRATPAAR